VGGGSWLNFSDERLKNIKGQFTSGLKAVMQLQPLRYEYKNDNALGLVSSGEHIGFGAQAVQRIIPEAVTSTSSGYLQVNNDPIIFTMLNAIKEQQKEIEQLRTEVRKLRARSNRRR
ncbi:MAG TPA: tail fiber domain-containing protein, partial [Pyrinomonadaceae bacterium]|nr:tail fiber domain-containing protein [Pyrinomonadaceae bacterium]